MLRSDQEPAILHLLGEIAKAGAITCPQGRATFESSPVGESRSNGFIESGIRSLEDLVRTLKASTEQRIGTLISTQLPVFMCMVEHAADLLTKFGRGDDGLTPLPEIKGPAITQ